MRGTFWLFNVTARFQTCVCVCVCTCVSLYIDVHPHFLEWRCNSTCRAATFNIFDFGSPRYIYFFVPGHLFVPLIFTFFFSFLLPLTAATLRRRLLLLLLLAAFGLWQLLIYNLVIHSSLINTSAISWRDRAHLYSLFFLFFVPFFFFFAFLIRADPRMQSWNKSDICWCYASAGNDTPYSITQQLHSPTPFGTREIRSQKHLWTVCPVVWNIDECLREFNPFCVCLSLVFASLCFPPDFLCCSHIQSDTIVEVRPAATRHLSRRTAPLFGLIWLAAFRRKYAWTTSKWSRKRVLS